MTPPLSKYHLELLNSEFYTNMNYTEHPSRRQIAEWLSNQEVNQLYHPSKGKPKDIKTSMTTPNTILAINLVNMEKFQTNGFKYLFNGIDMGSLYLYIVRRRKKQTDTEVLKAFKKIYTQSNIRAIRSDNGSEFISDKFKRFFKRK